MYQYRDNVTGRHIKLEQVIVVGLKSIWINIALADTTFVSPELLLHYIHYVPQGS